MDRGIVQTTIDTCRAVIEYAQLKCVGALGVLTYSFFFGDIQEEVIASVVFLTIFDTITGIMASVKTGQDIKSKKFLVSAVKLFIYMLLISSGHLAENVIGYDVRIDEVITIYIGFTEIISILENASRMGYAIPKKLLNQLKDFKSEK